MTEEEALLEAVLRNPEDDTVRLVYADWLDEQGGDANADRALFIRNQIKIRRLVPCAHTWAHDGHKDCEFCTANALDEWFHDNPYDDRPDRAWRPGVWFDFPKCGPLSTNIYWKRGFVYAVTTGISVNSFIDGARSLGVFPLEYIRLHCKEPSRTPGRGLYRWDNRGCAATQAHVIPHKLWDTKLLRRQFDTSGQAVDALSEVCVRFVREQYIPWRRQKG